jgi:hypothetical protein
VAHHQQTAGPGGEHRFESGEADEVQVPGWLVEDEQFWGRLALSAADERDAHAFAGAEAGQTVRTVATKACWI